jgi:hypothetical protein
MVSPDIDQFRTVGLPVAKVRNHGFLMTGPYRLLWDPKVQNIADQVVVLGMISLQKSDDPVWARSKMAKMEVRQKQAAVVVARDLRCRFEGKRSARRAGNRR